MDKVLDFIVFKVMTPTVLLMGLVACMIIWVSFFWTLLWVVGLGVSPPPFITP